MSGDSGENAGGKKKRVFALAAITAVAWIAMLIHDDGGLKVLGGCLVRGALTVENFDGRKFQTDYYGMKYYGTMDNWIDQSVYLWGAHEKSMLHAMRDVLALTNPKSDAVSVDIGANVGTHTLFLAKHSATVHAIEPWPTVLVRLERHVTDNALPNVVIHPVGVAAKAGTLPFHVPPDWNMGRGSFSNSFAKARGSEGVIDLPLVVGDDYFADKQIAHVDLIKIDIEGYERPAMQGFRKIMERDRPAVFLELNVANEEGYHSEADLRGSFPDDYEFLEILDSSKMSWGLGGERFLVCTHDPGDYTLIPFDMSFAQDTRSLLAVPKDIYAKLEVKQ